MDLKQSDITKILEVGSSLSSEQDLNRLLEHILCCAMELARCDAGTLYLLDGNSLRFKILRNNTLRTYAGGDGIDPALPPVSLHRANVCAMALLDAKTIRIEDVKHCQDYDFSGPIRYDAMTGYDTRSMLVVPMHSREGEKIGVLQLINALDEQGNVCAFAEDMALMAESVASQAAITIQNVRYVKEIQGLFQSFVDVMSAAIDERTPYNVSHSRRMANCGVKFWDYLAEKTGDRARFSNARRRELRMSLLLHDIGKVTTPLEVMDKAERLSPLQKERLLHRLHDITLIKKIDCLEGRLSKDELGEFHKILREAEERVHTINTAGFVTEEQLAWLDGLKQRTYLDLDGSEHPWLTDEEYTMLSIRRGTLSDQERLVMENHVVMTDKLLSQIQFSKGLSHVRAWASAHHELLNGQGYPKHLMGEQISLEVRIITILDIFDALVADDRPYKQGKPPETALDILKSDAQNGRLDPVLVDLFVESRCWEEFY